MATGITLEELRAFHTIDRHAYARLVTELGLASCVCKRIVAFWNSLERIGYWNFVHNTLPLSEESLGALVSETTKCLNCLTGESFPVGDNDVLPVMSSVASKTICQGIVYINRENAKRNMKKFMETVCEIAFNDDIMPENLANGAVLSLTSGDEVVQVQDYESHSSSQMVAYKVQDNESHSSSQTVDDQGEDFERHLQILIDEVLEQDNGSHSQPRVEGMMVNRQANQNQNRYLDRQSNPALFVTFSKGHPCSQEELEEFFIRRYGQDCIKEIEMHMEEPALFARVIVNSPEYIERILGERELLQFNVNGKDVRIRRYTDRRAEIAPPLPSQPNRGLTLRI